MCFLAFLLLFPTYKQIGSKKANSKGKGFFPDVAKVGFIIYYLSKNFLGHVSINDVG